MKQAQERAFIPNCMYFYELNIQRLRQVFDYSARNLLVPSSLTKYVALANAMNLVSSFCALA
jgi:hypothetical protein